MLVQRRGRWPNIKPALVYCLVFAVICLGGDTAVVTDTIHVVNFACLNFREFLILVLFTKFRIRELFFFFSSATLKGLSQAKIIKKIGDFILTF